MKIKHSFLFLMSIFSCLYSSRNPKTQYMAVSIRNTIEESRINRGYLYGINMVAGYVVDQQNSDLILLGKKGGCRERIHVDDLVALIQNVLDGNSAPQCRIVENPQATKSYIEMRERLFTGSEAPGRKIAAWRTNPLSNDIIVSGINPYSHLAAFLVDLDCFLKGVVTGREKIRGLRRLSYHSLNLDMRKQGLESSSGSRDVPSPNFWFKQKTATLFESPQAALISGADLYLCTFDDNNKQQFSNIATERFREQFNDNIERIKSSNPKIRLLGELFRFYTLLKTSEESGALSVIGNYDDYLKNYNFIRHDPPKQIPVQYVSTYIDAPSNIMAPVKNKQIFRYSYVFTYGGITFEPSGEPKLKQMSPELSNRLQSKVVEGRTAQDQIWWNIDKDISALINEAFYTLSQ